MVRAKALINRVVVAYSSSRCKISGAVSRKKYFSLFVWHSLLNNIKNTILKYY